jgi:hypothetical protein
VLEREVGHGSEVHDDFLAIVSIALPVRSRNLVPDQRQLSSCSVTSANSAHIEEVEIVWEETSTARSSIA